MHRLNPIVLVWGLIVPACGGGGGGSPAGPSSGSSIGPSGGTVAGAGGAVRLVVPAGALSAPVALSIRSATSLPLDPHAVAGTAFAVEPAGTVFATPATLTLRYDPALGPSGVAETGLRVHVLNGGEWDPLAGATTDTGPKESSAPIPSTGSYGVRWIGPETPCSSAEDRQFDFWLGSWEYHQGSLPVADNEITKEGRDCLVEEHFQDPAGGRGRSVSLFSRLDRRWHQTYIDTNGTRLVLIGSLAGPRMVLNQGASDRFSWDPIAAGTVRYYGEHSADGGNTWTVNFDSRYTRR